MNANTNVKMKWKRGTTLIGEPLENYLSKILDEELAKGYGLRVSIGTDSQRSGRGHKFATVILIATTQDLGGGIVVGRGGLIISATYHIDGLPRTKKGVNQRMIIEVSKSIEAASEIAELMDMYGIKLEIHADINPDPKWESNKALQEAIGYILGMGYEFKIKPDAFATKGADHLCQ